MVIFILFKVFFVFEILFSVIFLNVISLRPPAIAELDAVHRSNPEDVFAVHTQEN